MWHDDWLAIPAGTRAISVGALHEVGNVVVVLLFVVSWYVRALPACRPIPQPACSRFWRGTRIVDGVAGLVVSW
jgi:hypothetical protein